MCLLGAGLGEGEMGPRRNCYLSTNRKTTGTNMSFYTVGGGGGTWNPLERLRSPCCLLEEGGTDRGPSRFNRMQVPLPLRWAEQSFVTRDHLRQGRGSQCHRRRPRQVAHEEGEGGRWRVCREDRGGPSGEGHLGARTRRARSGKSPLGWREHDSVAPGPCGLRRRDRDRGGGWHDWSLHVLPSGYHGGKQSSRCHRGRGHTAVVAVGLPTR